MKKALIALVIFVILIGLVVLISPEEKMPETLAFTGTIDEVAETTLRVNSEDGSLENVSLSDETRIVNAADEAVAPGYLRRGFRVSVDALLHDNVYIASDVVVLEEPDVLLSNLAPHDVVESPLHISGEARGWYFEGSFPVDLISPDGSVLAQAPAEAIGDWMTSEYVPFEVMLSWNAAESGEGAVVFHKANPSGLPENDASVTVPVVFSGGGEGAGRETLGVAVYFNRDVPGASNIACDAVFPVERTIPRTQATARAALVALLQGPTADEETNFYFTSIPEDTELQSIRIEEGVAYADFNEAIDQGVGGSCLVAAIRAQIEETLLQFSTVDDVVISRNGETETILQP